MHLLRKKSDICKTEGEAVGQYYEDFTRRVDQAAEYLKLTRTQYEFAKHPERELLVSIPVEMDDGTVEIFKGYRVQHSSLLGPYEGGIRFSPQVDHNSMRCLAGLMTLKCTLAGLPFGGAMGGVKVQKEKLSPAELARLTRRYTAMILPVIGPDVDILAPDAGTDEEVMGWIMDTYSMMAGRAISGIVTGKPQALGGSLGRKDAAGHGAVFVLKEALKRLKLPQDCWTAALAGFGKVGRSAAMSMYEEGVRIEALSDSSGGIRREGGLDIPALVAYKEAGGCLRDYHAAGVQQISGEAVLESECTVLAVCASSALIDGKNAPKLQARMVLECGNAQITPEGDGVLEERGILVIPDLVASAGSVIVDYFERVQNVQSLMWDEYEVNRMMKNLLLKTFDRVWAESARMGLSLRRAAYILALDKVCEAKRIRGIFP